MKRRTAKKIASRFMNAKKHGKIYTPYGVYTEEYQAYNDGRLPLIKTFAWFPLSITQHIEMLAKKDG